MDTQFGPTLNTDAFESPFNEIISDFIQKGRLLHDSLRAHMRPQWKQRPLDILIIENALPNACATDHAGCDCVCIFRGALEQIYGAVLGLLSTPAFFPAIGDVTSEVRPQRLPGGRFPSVPLLRTAPDTDRRKPLFFPNDRTRMTVAQILADLALEFLVCHEIGHILGGHLEIPRNSQRLSTIAELQYAINVPDDSIHQHVLECDADAFASQVTWWVHSREDTAAPIRDLVNAPDWQSKDFALLTYLMATGVLFRVFYPSASLTIEASKSSHPHPAVRACLIGSSAMARGLHDGSFTAASLARIVEASVGNIEDVWADFCLSGQIPGPSNVWAMEVHHAAMALFESYGNARTLLEQYARIPRRWDDWDWPKEQ